MLLGTMCHVQEEPELAEPGPGGIAPSVGPVSALSPAYDFLNYKNCKINENDGN